MSFKIVYEPRAKHEVFELGNTYSISEPLRQWQEQLTAEAESAVHFSSLGMME